MDKQIRFLSLPAAQLGAAAIEFAFILPMLLLLFTGMIEFGRAMWYYDALDKGARDAARYLSTVPTASLSSEAASAASTTRTIVANAATKARVVVTGLDPLAYINVTCAPSCASPSTVTVAINYPFVIGGWIPIIGYAPPAAPAGITAALVPHVTMRYMR